jgi:hypothetical protein
VHVLPVLVLKSRCGISGITGGNTTGKQWWRAADIGSANAKTAATEERDSDIRGTSERRGKALAEKREAVVGKEQFRQREIKSRQILRLREALDHL